MMSRRVIPALFWIGCLGCSLLVVVSVLRAGGPRPSAPNVKGSWDGFFLSNDGTLGGFQSDVMKQDFRRIAGDGFFFDLGSSALFNTCNWDATVTGNNFITGTALTETGRLVFHADLGPFAGL